MLMVLVILAVLGFRSSDNLGAAYGIAVTGTMTMTTLLALVVARKRWNWSMLSMNGASARPLCLISRITSSRPRRQVAIIVKITDAQHQRKPAAVLDLAAVGAEERHVDEQEQHADQHDRGRSSATAADHDQRPASWSIVIVPITAMP